MKFLVIDREASIRTIMAILIAGMGHSTVEAMTCGEGIEKLTTGKFDVVITSIRTSDPSDIDSPNGFAVVDRVREISGTWVILSANQLSSDDEKLCYAHPPDAFLHKPFESWYFRAVVGTMLVT